MGRGERQGTQEDSPCLFTLSLLPVLGISGGSTLLFSSSEEGSKGSGSEFLRIQLIGPKTMRARRARFMGKDTEAKRSEAPYPKAENRLKLELLNSYSSLLPAKVKPLQVFSHAWILSIPLPSGVSRVSIHIWNRKKLACRRKATC